MPALRCKTLGHPLQRSQLRAPCGRRNHLAVAVRAEKREDGPSGSSSTRTREDERLLRRATSSFDGPSLNEDDRVRLRAEAEAPWRGVRFVLFGFATVSASVGLLTSLPQVIGAVGGARNAMPLEDALTNVAVNGIAAGLFAFLISRDLKAKDKQMTRLGREERLSACCVQLANGRVLPLGQLRGSVRAVIVAGTTEQVREHLAAAEPFKAELQRRGVLVVPLPIYESSEGSNGASSPLEPPSQEELRWRVTAVRLDEWRAWFEQQLSTSKATSERGLYVSLRKDGRVRGSGKGCPPWAMLAAQLPPEEGIWTGLLDGMDGRV